MAEPTITDQEFRESADNRERMYETELHRQPVPADDLKERTFMDRLGRGRWPIDYYTARARGHNHQAAMQVERCEIRKAAGLPPTESYPPDPTPPPTQPPPTQPPADKPGVKDDAERFASFYLAQTRSTGFKPDASTTHDQQMLFLRDCILAFGDPSIKMKRASETRPISNEVIVFTRPTEQYRWFWDIIKGAGTANWEVNAAGPGEYLPTAQPLVDPQSLQIIPG